MRAFAPNRPAPRPPTAPVLRGWRRCLPVAAVAFLLGAAGCAGPEARPPQSPPVSPADAVLARWVAALGGEAAIRAVQNVDARGTARYPGQPPITTRVRATNHGQYRFESELGNGTLVQASDGAVAWQQHSRLGFGFLPPAEHQARLTVTDLQAALLVKARYGTRERLPDEVVGGRPRQVLKMRRPGQPVEKWTFDPATGYRVRIERADAAGEQAVEFGDFRPMRRSGVLEPHRVVTINGPQRLESQLEDVVCNVPLTAGLFAPPVEATTDNLEVGRLLFRYASFSGGPALRRVDTRIIEEESVSAATGMRVSSTTYLKRPGRIATEEVVPGMGSVWQGFDGTTGWAWSEIEGFRRIEGAELQQLMGRAGIDAVLTLGETAALRRLLPERTEGGRRIAGVALAVAQGEIGEMYFDAATGELVRSVSVAQAGAAGQLKITLEYSDYREVDGVRLPFRLVMNNSALRTEITVKSVRQNVPVDDAVFRPRRE